MTTLFEKYELRRNKYNPGVYWRDTPLGYHTIKELVTVSESQVKGKSVRKLFTSGNPSNNVTFMVTASSHTPHEELGPGKYVSWSKEYMEKNYELGNFTIPYLGRLYRYEPV